MRGLALALSWFTVLPVRTGAPDARTAAAAVRWAPLVGGLLGAAAGGLLVGLATLGVAPLVAGLLVVGLLALATRGMHVDGLADTADGLGCYGPPERALAVMRDGGAGPFGVATLIVVLGVQAAAVAALVTPALLTVDVQTVVTLRGVPMSEATVPDRWPPPVRDAPGPLATVALVALAAATGRAGFAWGARRGVPAARPGGFGAQVAGSQPGGVAPAWWLVLAAAGWALAGPRGAVAVAAAAAVAVALSWHTARRFGGTTGDVLGAIGELGTAAALVVLASG